METADAQSSQLARAHTGLGTRAQRAEPIDLSYLSELVTLVRGNQTRRRYLNAESELQRLESNHSELLLHQGTLRKQLAFKNEQLKQFQVAVNEPRPYWTRSHQRQSEQMARK
ncbi:hypothetical protein GQ600_750 [Phytophthora cactorum]|nr:hypothetical protein GQ600_750 [Phytophthora cactorum]